MSCTSACCSLLKYFVMPFFSNLLSNTPLIMLSYIPRRLLIFIACDRFVISVHTIWLSLMSVLIFGTFFPSMNVRNITPHFFSMSFALPCGVFTLILICMLGCPFFVLGIIFHFNPITYWRFVL